jgi:O-antigen/teichoic acid export membrane protein
LLLRALPVGASLILFAFYGRIGFFVMSWKESSLSEIGLLTTAVTMTSLLIFVPVTWSSVILPIFSSLYSTGRERARQFHEQTLSAVLLCGLCVTAVLVGTADPLLKFLLGPEFAAAGPAVIIMAASLPLGFMSYVYKCLLVPLRREKSDLAATLAGIVVHMGASLVLIDRFGTLGVAVAYFLAEVVVFVIKLVVVMSVLGPISFVQTLVKPALCGAAVFAAGYFLRQCEIPWILRPAGVLATLACLIVVTRSVSVELLGTFRSGVQERPKTSTTTRLL